jgi:hypothetical protein
MLVGVLIKCPYEMHGAKIKISFGVYSHNTPSSVFDMY